MVKAVIRNILIYTYILFFLTKVVPGVLVDGGLVTFLMGGASLAAMFMILKPILNLISFPINLMTMGLVSLLINALILYLLTIFASEFSIVAFNYPRMEISGFVIPKTEFNTFFAYVYSAAILSMVHGFIQWVRE